MKTEITKGFKDYLGKEAEKKAIITEVIRQTFERYNFQYVETPLIEKEEFVKGDNPSDEAVSDIFKLKDKGKRKLALRYEFTFQLKRIFNNQKLPYKRFQIGPVFRDEPVKGNRLRQFIQCDIDVIGSTIKDEAELLFATKEILDALKINFKIYINNRKLLNEIMNELGIKEKEQALREIDKLDKISKQEVKKNLDKINAGELLNVVFKKQDFFKKYQAYNEIKELIKYCAYFGVEVVFVPFLARGLSYYQGNIFEVKTPKMQETICAGGNYLIKGVSCSGISFGLERLCLLSNLMIDIEKYLVVSLDKDKKAIQVTKQLRKQNKNVSIYYGKPSKALEYANSYDIRKVIFVGEKEIKKKKIKIKNMTSGKETLIEISKLKKIS